MTNSTGINGDTGVVLTDWAHTQQSIRKILDTALESRVMRREFGSDLPELIDRKMTSRNVLAIYSAAAAAIARWEPRFRMRTGRIARAGYVDDSGRERTVHGDGGTVSVELFGTYYPRAHRGDFSLQEERSFNYIVEVAS